MRDQRNALKELEDEVILPTDKRNATVVMKREENDTKMLELVKTTTYRWLERDPTATQENRLNRKLKG